MICRTNYIKEILLKKDNMLEIKDNYDKKDKNKDDLEL